ncbi:MAG: DUF3095 domain-containing protein [Synechococcaceae cyanobacterium SM2_3_1]|nr:DUF3095 domain-containing protein [Synechococcaceae cyanobacterium SM2_3_1]
MEHLAADQEFYQRLPHLEHLIQATDLARYTEVPLDWQVFVTDIRGSTQAITEGRYKEVNMIAAGSIAAVLNVVNPLEIPFVFGGDGATLVVPPGIQDRVRKALLATRQLAAETLNLDLRVGQVAVQVLKEAGYPLKVAKLQLSKNFTQALFIGGGLSHAEKLIKDPQQVPSYLLQATGEEEQADFTGLECRWQDIPSPYGEVVSLLVMAILPDLANNIQVYQQVIQIIDQIYGDSSKRNPIHPQGLKLTLAQQQLSYETKVQTYGQSAWKRWIYLQWIRLTNLLGMVLMGLRVKTSEVDWGEYKSILIAATDFEKFDEVLRMVIAGTPHQRQALMIQLENMKVSGSLVYGYHLTNRALMTCLVYERGGRQMHFVDGAEGGYALAARMLKDQLKERIRS